MDYEPSYTEKLESEKRIALAQHVLNNSENEEAKSFARGMLMLGNASKLNYKILRDIIEDQDLNDELEICRDCGEWPEYGACNSCKMD